MPKKKIFIWRRGEVNENPRAIDMLERRFSLDSLAALTILFRLNHEDENNNGDPKAPRAIDAWTYACAIFRVLMMLGSQFITDELKNDIFRLFSQRVFSLVTSFWGARFDVGAHDYARMSSLLREEAANKGIYIRSPLNRIDHNRIVRLINIPLIRINSA